NCGKNLKVADEAADKQACCPGCKQLVPIPAEFPTVTGQGPGPFASPGVSEAETQLGDGGPAAPAQWAAILAPPQQPDEIGRLGPSRVFQVLGAGGMGVVFQAQDPGLQRLVALKAMLPGMAADPSARERFVREARAAAAIKHDRIVT